MRSRPLVLLALGVLFVSGIAGCLDAKKDLVPPADDPVKSTNERVLDILSLTQPIPGFNRDNAVRWWERFVTTYAGRQSGTPKNVEAAAFLQGELQKAGYKAETLIVKGPVYGALSAVPQEMDYRIVRGLREGVGNASHRIALVSHYDIIHVGGATWQGAYDDGAGVAVQMEVCKALAKVPLNKTIECLFFDGEEMGLVASRAYMADYAKGGKDYVYDQAFGYDMTGLNWPGHPNWKLYAFIGLHQHERLTEEMQAGHQSFLSTTIHNFMSHGYANIKDGVEIQQRNRRNSDEQNFERAGVPVVRFAGGHRADHYPMYHRPGDTVEYVYNFACGNCTISAPTQALDRGRDAFVRGVEMVVLVSYYTIVAFDQFDPYQVVA